MTWTCPFTQHQTQKRPVCFNNTTVLLSLMQPMFPNTFTYTTTFTSNSWRDRKFTVLLTLISYWAWRAQSPLPNLQTDIAVSMFPRKVKDWPPIYNLFILPEHSKHTATHFLSIWGTRCPLVKMLMCIAYKLTLLINRPWQCMNECFVFFPPWRIFDRLRW